MAGSVADFGSFVITGIWLYRELKRLDSKTDLNRVLSETTKVIDRFMRQSKKYFKSRMKKLYHREFTGGIVS